MTRFSDTCSKMGAMNCSRWGILFLIGVVTIACSQVAQPTSQSGLVLTRVQDFTRTPIILTSSVPTVEPTPCIPCNKMLAYERISGNCSAEECLFRTEYEGEGDYPVGVATIKGYYTQVERIDFGDTKKVCDGFVIVGGSQGVIESVLALVDAGNGIYGKNELNQPVINLDLSILDESETKRILDSTPNEPIALIVLAHAPSHMGGTACFTRFEILKVKSIN